VTLARRQRRGHVAIRHASRQSRGARRRRNHLKYHLATVEVLTRDQVARYAELRGYAGGAAKPHQH
jgi:hypothetical protein